MPPDIRLACDRLRKAVRCTARHMAAAGDPGLVVGKRLGGAMVKASAAYLLLADPIGEKHSPSPLPRHLALGQ